MGRQTNRHGILHHYTFFMLTENKNKKQNELTNHTHTQNLSFLKHQLNNFGESKYNERFY